MSEQTRGFWEDIDEAGAAFHGHARTRAGQMARRAFVLAEIGTTALFAFFLVPLLSGTALWFYGPTLLTRYGQIIGNPSSAEGLDLAIAVLSGLALSGGLAAGVMIVIAMSGLLGRAVSPLLPDRTLFGPAVLGGRPVFGPYLTLRQKCRMASEQAWIRTRARLGARTLTGVDVLFLWAALGTWGVARHTGIPASAVAMYSGAVLVFALASLRAVFVLAGPVSARPRRRA